MPDIGSLLGSAGIGGAIGQAVVRLELDSKKYVAEMEAAKGQTVASTNAMGTSTSKFGSLASTAFLAAGAAAVVGLGLSVNAAIEAQEAHERLANTVKNSAVLSEDSVAAFENQAEAIRSVTGADDEAIISGQALMGQMGLTEDQILSLTPRVVDLATKFNIDLNTAFKAVGKAAQGNTGTLARYVGTIEAGATPAETFANVLDKLGASAGFAAQQAKNEPWRLLKSDMEEIAEEIGTALLPALASLADLVHQLIPLVATLADGIKFLPLFQMSEDIGHADDALHGFLNGLVDTIPVLGHFVELTNTMSEAGKVAAGVVIEHAGVVETLSKFYRDKLSPAVQDTSKQIVKFAHKTSAEIKEWGDKIKESFDTYVLSLEDTAEAQADTATGLKIAIRNMLDDARKLSRAMREISREDWVNTEFIAFLSEQGPEWLIGFADMTVQQQHKAQEAWEISTQKTNKAKESLDRITGVLKDMDTGNTKHTVEIHYQYVGFDPSKPGMSKQQK